MNEDKINLLKNSLDLTVSIPGLALKCQRKIFIQFLELGRNIK